VSDGPTKAILEGRDTLTADEAREYVAAEIWDRFGMTLEEFYERAEAGELPDDPAIPHLVLLTGARSPGC
jgi:hypothetical protein